MSAIGAATRGMDMAHMVMEKASLAISEGVITPEIVSAQSMAETQMDVQVSVLKEALAAEAQIFDVLI